jgi:hypothetical protein
MLLQALQPVQIIERYRSNPLVHGKFKSKAPYKKRNKSVSKENKRLLLFETSFHVKSFTDLSFDEHALILCRLHDQHY